MSNLLMPVCIVQSVLSWIRHPTFMDCNSGQLSVTDQSMNILSFTVTHERSRKTGFPTIYPMIYLLK